MSANRHGFFVVILTWGYLGAAIFGLQLANNYYIEWQPYGEVCTSTEAQDQIRDIRKLLEKD